MHDTQLAALLFLGLFVAVANLTAAWKQWRNEKEKN